MGAEEGAGQDEKAEEAPEARTGARTVSVPQLQRFFTLVLQKLLQAAAVETAEAAEAAPATEEATEPIPGRIGTDTTCKLTKHDSKGNLHLEAE